MWQSLEILNVFSTLFLKQVFWKTQTFFKKLEYRFLIESIEIENATFPYKTALQEASVKTNRMGSTKCIYHKERSFAGKYFIFLKFSFQLNNLVDLMYQPPKFIILFESVGVLFEGAFFLWVSLKRDSFEYHEIFKNIFFHGMTPEVKNNSF